MWPLPHCHLVVLPADIPAPDVPSEASTVVASNGATHISAASAQPMEGGSAVPAQAMSAPISHPISVTNSTAQPRKEGGNTASSTQPGRGARGNNKAQQGGAKGFGPQ